MVLEPLPRRAVRLRELHLRLPVLRRSCSTSGSGRSTSRSSPRSSATSTTSSTGSTSAAHMRFDARGHVGRLRRVVARRGRVTVERRHRVPRRASSSPRPACCRCRTSPTCRDARISGVSSTTPGCGRRRRSSSPASASRSIGTGSSGVQLDARHRRRGRLAHRLPAQRELVHAAQQLADHARTSRRNSEPTSSRCARR